MLPTIVTIVLPLLIAVAGLAYVIGDAALGRHLVPFVIALVVIIPCILELRCQVARVVHEHGNTLLIVFVAVVILAVAVRLASLPPSSTSRKRRIQRKD